jgi:hypothetical protein
MVDPTAENLTMTDTSLARALASSTDRVSLQASACRSLTAQDFRAGLAPLGRLLLTLDPGDPERPVVLACLAVVYARLGRPAAARRALRDAEAAASDARALASVQLARSEVGPVEGSVSRP